MTRIAKQRRDKTAKARRCLNRSPHEACRRVGAELAPIIAKLAA
jgi:hypothetical protein